MLLFKYYNHIKLEILTLDLKSEQQNKVIQRNEVYCTFYLVELMQIRHEYTFRNKAQNYIPEKQQYSTDHEC